MTLIYRSVVCVMEELGTTLRSRFGDLIADRVWDQLGHRMELKACPMMFERCAPAVLLVMPSAAATPALFEFPSARRCSTSR